MFNARTASANFSNQCQYAEPAAASQLRTAFVLPEHQGLSLTENIKACFIISLRTSRPVSTLGLQVAKELVALHNELLRGEGARLERLRRTAPAASSASRREQVHTPSHTLFLLTTTLLGFQDMRRGSDIRSDWSSNSKESGW